MCYIVFSTPALQTPTYTFNTCTISTLTYFVLMHVSVFDCRICYRRQNRG